MTDNNICKVCGTSYPPNEGACPICGARKGATIPAWLRCKQCGTVFSSALDKCPTCGQTASPRTAEVAFLKDAPEENPHTALTVAEEGTRKSRKPGKPKRRKPWLVPCIAFLSLVVVIIAETLIVRGIYSRSKFNACMELWENDSRIDQNRKAPDPEYHEPEQQEIPDRLFNDSTEEGGLEEDLNNGMPPEDTPAPEEEQQEAELTETA